VLSEILGRYVFETIRAPAGLQKAATAAKENIL
jgi:hypothetical protein